MSKPLPPGTLYRCRHGEACAQERPAGWDWLAELAQLAQRQHAQDVVADLPSLCACECWCVYVWLRRQGGDHER